MCNEIKEMQDAFKELTKEQPNFPTGGSPRSGELEKRLALRRKRKKTRWICIMVFVVVAVAIILLLCFAPFGFDKVVADMQAQKITKEVMTREQLRQSLQEAADNSNFRVKLNTAPTSADGKTVDWCIVNSADNSYDMQVTIRSNAGDTLYQSELLAPGGEILVGPLQAEIADGNYDATATVTAYDKESGEEKGQVTVDLILTVKR